MATEVLDIVDTAVKIGLGAFISGVSTYLVTNLNHKKTLEKEKSKRRNEIIENIAIEIEELFALLFSYRAFLHDYIKARNDKSPFEEERFNQAQAMQNKIPESYRKITNSEAKLLLLGEKNCQQVIRQFGDEVKNARKTVKLGNSELSLDETDSFREMLLKQREMVFNELSNIFNA